MKTKTIDAQGKRIVAISDIHGNVEWLKKLLEKINFCKNDLLVIVGDYLEKGGDSLATLRYLMELNTTHHVEMVLGNCDIQRYDLDDTEENRKFIIKYMQKRDKSILNDMRKECNIELCEENFGLIRRTFLEKYAEEIEFMDSPVHVLEIGRYRFVHAGLTSDNPDEWERYKCLKFGNFVNLAGKFDKYCVVGHWPVMLYRTDKINNNVFVDREKHIISIDGGNVIKQYGQINALIIPDADRDEFSYTSYDDYPQVRVLESQADSQNSTLIKYLDNKIRIINKGEEFSVIERQSDGYPMLVPTKYLFELDGSTCVFDVTDYVMPTIEGEIIACL